MCLTCCHNTSNKLVWSHLIHPHGSELTTSKITKTTTALLKVAKAEGFERSKAKKGGGWG